MSRAGSGRFIDLGDTFLLFLHAAASLVAVMVGFRFVPAYCDEFKFKLPEDAVRVQFFLWVFALSLFFLSGANILAAYFRKSGRELAASRKASRLGCIFGAMLLLLGGGHVLAHADARAGTGDLGYIGLFMIFLALLSGVLAFFASLGFNREDEAEAPARPDPAE